MGLVIITFVIGLAVIILATNEKLIRSGFDDLCYIIGGIFMLAWFIMSGVLLIQVTTRESDAIAYKEKQNMVLSFSQNAKSISEEQQKDMINEITVVNRHIRDTRRYINNILIGMYYNPLVRDMETQDYSLITKIPLHQQTNMDINNNIK